MEGYQEIGWLGKGSFGEVVQVRRLQDDQVIAQDSLVFDSAEVQRFLLARSSHLIDAQTQKTWTRR